MDIHTDQQTNSTPEGTTAGIGQGGVAKPDDKVKRVGSCRVTLILNFMEWSVKYTMLKLKSTKSQSKKSKSKI